MQNLLNLCSAAVVKLFENPGQFCIIATVEVELAKFGHCFKPIVKKSKTSCLMLINFKLFLSQNG